MKKFIILVLVLVAVGVGIPSFRIISDGVTTAAFSKVEDSKPALTIAEVEKLMGRPATIEHSESTGLTGDVYHYPYHGNEMKVVFVNGIVFHAEFIPGAKS